MVCFELFICILVSLKQKWLCILMSDLFYMVPDNNNSLYLNTVKTDGSCTADVAVYYNTKQYSTIQYNI